MPNIRERPSPNFAARPAGQRIDILLLHYTGMPDAASALDRLRDPAAKVSAHYFIDEDGAVTRLVAEADEAWHAGVSSWAGATDINARSIGIELVNPGHEFGYRSFPEAQMRSLLPLCRAVIARHGIPPQRVLGHSDVAPRRKEDPGELFDWPRLAAAGIGLWPSAPTRPGAPPRVDEIQAALRRFGYAAPASGELDGETEVVLRAFQRHFRRSAVTGKIDLETTARLHALLALLDAASPDT